ncbi:T9SS type A sorting domain-containing protein [Flavobacteriales bacterium]|nr:T9SS type A sorting domain-containing protein [Flavobacteriales bacterium]
MKKLYTIASLLFVSSVSFAQFSNTTFPEPTDVSTKILKSKKIYTSFAEKSTPFWSEDFSGGIPTTWTNGSTPTPPIISAPWVYRGPSTTPGVNMGSQGAYAGTQGPIASATASNGFMIFDSDYYDNGGTAGNFGAGTYPCNSITGGAPTGHVGTLTTDSIDCSMYSDVSILFHSFYREYTGIAKIAFSIDGGVTFTDTIEVHPDIEVNEVTANDYQVMIRMPFNIAGNPNVKIQFIYDGTILYNTSYNGYYFWQIDDIELVETPAHLLDINNETFGGWWVGYQNTGDLGIDFTFNPLNQATANPYRFESVVFNNGASDQYNTTMHVDVDASGSSVYTGSSNPMTLYTNTNDTLVTTTNFTPTSTGIHNITFWASSDSFPTTSTIGRSTIITDTVYGVDFDWDSDGANAGSGYYLGRSCGGQVLGNAFDIYEDDEVTSISFHVNDQSVAGAEVKVELYEIDAMVTPYSPIYLGESDSYELTQGDIGSWVTLKLDVTDVYASTTYVAAVRGFANPLDTSLISSSSNDNTLSFVQDNGCDIGSGGFGYWYSISKPLLIRLNLGYEVASSLDEDVFDGKLSVHPNPSKGIFNIDLIDVQNGDYLISVSNILGEEVYSDSRGVNSTTSTTINLSDLESGIYMLNIQNGDSSISKKLIIE